MPTNAIEIDTIAVERKESLDVLLVLRPPRYRLEDDQILGSRDSDADTT